MTTNQDTFNGFSHETINFLISLQENNNKAWFTSHKNEYQKYLHQPMQNLVMDLSEFMLTIDPYFETRPVTDKTISRIYRDTRFSKDKSPYKNRMWITFKRPNKDWKEAPAYFFEISPDSYCYGMGFFCASKNTMDGLRKMIDQETKKFLREISFYSKQQIFTLEGSKYKRILDKNMPESIQDWYQRRNLYLICRRKIDKSVFTKKLIDNLIFGFGLVAPFYKFLWKIKTSSK